MFNHKHYVSGDKDFKIPAHLNFGKYILNRIRLRSDEVALENNDTNDTLTYKDMTRFAVNLAVSLNKLGVGVGDVVALGCESRKEIIPAMFGVIFTGATYICFDIDIGVAVLKHQLEISKPKYLIASNLFLNTYKDKLEGVNSLYKIIRIEDDESIFSVKSLYAKYDDIDVDLFEPAKVQGQTDVAIIEFSSGTTGMPKAVQKTHVNCLSSFMNRFDNDSNKSQTDFACANWYHMYSLFTTITSLIEGNKVVYINNVENLARCIHKHKVVEASVEPYYFNSFLKCEELDKLNLDSLKVMFSTGSPLPVKTIEEVKKRLPNLEGIYQIYGMTEVGGVTTNYRGSKGTKPGSVGEVVSGVTLKVVDTKTREVLGPNQPGEICCKGPALMKGYIRVDASTTFDEDDFFPSGDLGYYDEDGCFFILNRLKDIIIYEGTNIAPAQLEKILLQHPGVEEVAVAGKPVPDFGEEPTAFVVRKKGSAVTEQELIDYLAGEVPPDMQLKGGVKFLEQLPKNASGKLLRRLLVGMLDAS